MTAPRTAGKLVLPVLALSQIAASLMAIAPSTASAHGSMSFPVSREVACKLEGGHWSGSSKFSGCKAAATAVDDWTANVQAKSDGNHQQLVPNGKLCGGGKAGSWAELDNPKHSWPTATVLTPGADGKMTFRYAQSAPHYSKYFEVFISKDSYDPARPLTWNDLVSIGKDQRRDKPELSGELASRKVGYTDIAVTLPAWATGKRVVYTVWQRAPDDNDEAFYSCSDVDVASANVQWKHSGEINKRDVVLNQGMKVTLRVFDRARGSDVERHEIVVAAGQQQPEKWVYALAQQVNQKSRIVKLGKLVNNEVKPLESATDNAVYGLNKAYNFEIETSMGEIKPPPVDEIAPGKVTVSGKTEAKAGEAVSLNAQAASGSNLKYLWTVSPNIAGLPLNTATLNFKAPTLKQDTAYNFQVKVSNSKGEQTAAHALTVKADDSGTTPPVEGEAWKEGASYKAGQVVVFEGKQYRCLQPHTAWAGSGWTPASQPALWALI
ncbi:lytic polysaccharide monooxygenase [Chromobacterium sp. LK11]|uniref:lytic polysaccharide monooxygenase n=1 Tax=Chromobacterium sp. LK11 TaxID=1628212 RepID=UPI0009E35796|nr:lytic polysaccharide monooxygenase [Chromobacterium sp. LK11]